ncbi:hypothetical protein VP01_295g3 [Puccinia sorghi]|uniref:Uncharacterized protein n=1 Tax=Puccinia sorghi TaxID=27349 RepID=A0A0L6V2M3_9BASI|nr:hypothetical protein VP01_295g3 [Puccinia sorghi]
MASSLLATLPPSWCCVPAQLTKTIPVGIKPRPSPPAPAARPEMFLELQKEDLADIECHSNHLACFTSDLIHVVTYTTERCLNANLNLSRVSHHPFHISNPNHNAKICFFNKSFNSWEDESRKNMISVFKFHPFSTMDLSLKFQIYQNLIQQLIAQSTYHNPNQSNGPRYACNMYILGCKNGYKISSKAGKGSKESEGYHKLQTHVPEQKNFIDECVTWFVVLYLMKSSRKTMPLTHLDWSQTSKRILTDLLSIYPSPSPTLPTYPHKDNNSSPFTSVM